jgi:aspartate/methionine/tyrosine aminotransferase
VEAGIRALRDGYHFYTPAKGLPELCQTVSAHIFKRTGVEVHPDHVMIVPGGKPTMFITFLMFAEPGAEVLYPNPGFPIYESMIRFCRAVPVPIELREETGFQFDPDEVLAKITPRTRLLIVNTPANPTGGIIRRAALDRLVAGLEKHPDVAILSDEIYSRMLYDGEEHVSLLEYESIRERLIVLDGWSKTYSMTGWRLGWGVWPASLIAHAERIQINSNSCASAPVQVAGIEALRGPQDAVERMMKAFDERRAVIVAELGAVPGFRCATPKGAFYAFPNITGTGMSSRELQNHLLLEGGVATVAGTAFGALGEGYVRFSYAASLDNIREGIKRVRECLQTVS